MKTPVLDEFIKHYRYFFFTQSKNQTGLGIYDWPIFPVLFYYEMVE